MEYYSTHTGSILLELWRDPSRFKL